MKMVLYEPAATLPEYAEEFNKRYPEVKVDHKFLSRLFQMKDINRKQVMPADSFL